MKIFGRYTSDSASKLLHENIVFRRSFYPLPFYIGYRDIVQRFPQSDFSHESPSPPPPFTRSYRRASSSLVFPLVFQHGFFRFPRLFSFSFVVPRFTADIALFIHSTLDSRRTLRVGVSTLIKKLFRSSS